MDGAKESACLSFNPSKLVSTTERDDRIPETRNTDFISCIWKCPATVIRKGITEARRGPRPTSEPTPTMSWSFQGTHEVTAARGAERDVAVLGGRSLPKKAQATLDDKRCHVPPVCGRSPRRGQTSLAETSCGTTCGWTGGPSP